MNNVLYLLPAGLADMDSRWPCVLIRAEQVTALQLTEAALLLAGEAIAVRLPLEMFSCWLSKPWPGRRRPSLQALQYALEDQLSVPLESLHWIVGAVDDQRRYSLRTCDASTFAALMALLAATGLHVASLHIDADFLPEHDPCALWLLGRWLVHDGCGSRLALSAAMLDKVRPRFAQDLLVLNAPGDDVLAAHHLLAANGAPVELLPVNRSPRRWPWRAGVLAISIGLALECGLNWASAWQHERATQALRAEAQRRLQTLLPPCSGAACSLKEQLRALQVAAVAPATTLSMGLTNLGVGLLGARDIKLQSLEYRAGAGWKIYLSAPLLAEVERLVEQGLQLQLQSARQVEGRTLAVLTLEDAQ